ncbi:MULTISPECIES: BolA family protein [Aliagarivorans]|uniref:BolA family protein n=1 Tax=Aliagarivorans TaxID=882379 RepID=UPI00041FB703|nr:MULTISPECIES: BolA family protein [Aliagarivorans]
MQADQVKEILNQQLDLEHLAVSGEGNHFEVVAVSEQFASMTRVKKQQVIYAPLKDYIASNEIHALTIKALSPEEWKAQQKFGQL